MTCHKIVSAMNAHLSDGPVDLLMSGHGGRAMLSGVLFVCVCCFVESELCLLDLRSR